MQPKHFFFITIFFIASASHAQFKKGTRMFGAAIGSSFFSNGKTEYSFPNGTQGYTANQNNLNINISPSIGWFLQNNYLVGVNLIFNSSHQKTWLESETNGNTYKKDNYRNTDFGIGGFFRYYLKTNAKVNPFAHAYFNAGSGSTKTDGFYYLTNFSQTYTGASSDRFFYNIGLNAGLTKMLSQSVGLEGYIGYAHSYNKFTTLTKAVTNNNGTQTTSEYQPTQKFNGNGINVGIGLQVFLDKK